jgi:hypothetical protein
MRFVCFILLHYLPNPVWGPAVDLTPKFFRRPISVGNAGAGTAFLLLWSVT